MRARSILIVLLIVCCVFALTDAEAQKRLRRHPRRAADTTVQKSARADLKYGANDFSLRTLAGSTTKLSSFGGRVVLVTIFSPSCSPCTSEVGGLVTAYTDFHERGFDILGVGVGTSETEMRTFIRTHELRWTCGINDTLPRQYGIVGLPDHFLFDKDGTLLEHYVGYLRADILRGRLESILPRRPSPGQRR
jgi:peroxiredoxin